MGHKKASGVITNQPEGAEIMFNSAQLEGLPAGSTNYAPLTGGQEYQATEANVKIPIPYKQIMKGLYVFCNPAPGVGHTATVQLRKNGANGNVVVTISGAATIGNSGSLQDMFDVGDFVDLEIVQSALSAASSINVALISVPA